MLDDLKWRTASACEQGACVSVAFDNGNALVRDSKDPDGPALRFTRNEWTAFVGGVAAGEFDMGEG